MAIAVAVVVVMVVVVVVVVAAAAMSLGDDDDDDDDNDDDDDDDVVVDADAEADTAVEEETTTINTKATIEREARKKVAMTATTISMRGSCSSQAHGMVQKSRRRRKCIVFECWINAFSSISVLSQAMAVELGTGKRFSVLNVLMPWITPEQEND